MNMREKIALALYVNLYEESDSGAYVETDPVSKLSVCLDGDFDLEALADAALSALETPTPEMVEAGQASYELDDEYGLVDEDLAAAYAAMIRKAKEG